MAQYGEKEYKRLDIKSEKGKEIFKRLVKDADVLIECFSPRVMPGLGLNYEILRGSHPRLIMASISNFGQTGSYKVSKADEIEAQAVGGIMYMTGDTEAAISVWFSNLSVFCKVCTHTLQPFCAVSTRNYWPGAVCRYPNNGMRTRTHRINIK